MAATAATREQERLSDAQRTQRASRRIEWAACSLEAACEDLEQAGEPLATQARDAAQAVETLSRDVAARVPAVRP